MKKKLVIYPKDLQLITGKAYYTSYKLLLRIRKHFGKKPNQVVTIGEACAYLGIKIEEVERILR